LPRSRVSSANDDEDKSPGGVTPSRWMPFVVA
jgi:hypothetical protein